MVPESLESLKIGMKVYHPTYGTGTITKREGAPGNPLLTIHFLKHGPRAVVARFAGLEIVL